MAVETLELTLEALAGVADHCLAPFRHAVRLLDSEALPADGYAGIPMVPLDRPLRLEARASTGERCPEQDLDLEIYRSGSVHNLMLSRVLDAQAPILWHGSHAVWLHPEDGQPCDRPPDRGMAMEGFCRRLRALISSDGGSPATI
jgi:hypothetical protein